jgi:protein phosphatase
LDSVPLFAVADGVGGQNAGEVASQTVVEILSHHFAKRGRDDQSQHMKQVIHFANRYLYEMSLEDDLLSGMATTLALILFDRQSVIIGHVGDSRVYRLAQGTLHRETLDHSLAEDQRYSSLGGRVGVNRNVITRALGVEPAVEPEMKTIPLSPDETFLLCTDGITRHVTDEELTEALTTIADPQAVCERLKELCYERGARDNLTAVVVKLDNGDWVRRLAAQKPQRSSAPTSRITAKSQTARIQVKLEDQTTFSEAGDASPTGHDAMTFSSHLEHGQGLVAPAEISNLKFAVSKGFWAVIIVVALAGSFVGGLYVQRNFTTNWLAWIDDEPDAPAEQFFDEGLRHFEAGQYAEAHRAFRESVNMSPTTPVYHHWLGRTQMSLKQYSEAARSFETAVTSNGAVENYLYAAAAHHAAGQKQRAEELLAAYLKAAR